MAARLLKIMILALLMTVAGCKERIDAEGETIRVVIGSETFTLELALDPPSRLQGLSDRDEMPADRGMLFAFPRPDNLTFVMRRCHFPIDLIYVGPGGRIVSLHRMKVEPADTPEQDLHRYPSGWDAQFAIELRGGALDRLELKPGQMLNLPWEALKQRAR